MVGIESNAIVRYLDDRDHDRLVVFTGELQFLPHFRGDVGRDLVSADGENLFLVVFAERIVSRDNDRFFSLREPCR